jgi:hypothetical protein
MSVYGNTKNVKREIARILKDTLPGETSTCIGSAYYARLTDCLAKHFRRETLPCGCVTIRSESGVLYYLRVRGDDAEIYAERPEKPL